LERSETEEVTKGEQRHARAVERTRKTIEKYEGKVALSKSWEKIDPEYCRRLKDQANRLRESLVIKGVL
jgi:hypothetical protein